MIVAGGVEVPPIDKVSDDDITDILDKIIQFAKSQLQGHERETFEFKKELKIKDKDEIRKDFSSFANTHGGLIIVGIDDGCALVGIQNITKDEQISQILSSDNCIQPPVKFSSRTIVYQGKTVLLYYIPESYDKIEVKNKKNTQWVVYERHNNTTRMLSQGEINRKFHPGAKKLPKHAQMDISQLGFYSSLDDSREPFIRWTIKNQGELYKWLKLPYMPLIPIPTMPFQYQSELYYSSTRWYGSYEKLPAIINNIENKLQDLGISFEVWTVPLSGAKTYLEDHHYISGCGANNLKRCLKEVHKNQRVTGFGWILFSSVIVIVTGEIHEKHCDIKVQSIFNFIPNNFPFISIDGAGRVALEPLPANKMDWWKEDRVVEWKSKDILPDAEDISDELLVSAPSAHIKGYLGDTPRPRNYNFPFRTKGLTLLEFTGSSDNSPEYDNPLLANTELIFCSLRSAPTGLNDLNEVRIGGMKLCALPFSQYLFHDFSLVLFDIECYVNQVKSYRMMAKE